MQGVWGCTPFTQFMALSRELFFEAGCQGKERNMNRRAFTFGPLIVVGVLVFWRGGGADAAAPVTSPGSTASTAASQANMSEDQPMDRQLARVSVQMPPMS